MNAVQAGNTTVADTTQAATTLVIAPGGYGGKGSAASSTSAVPGGLYGSSGSGASLAAELGRVRRLVGRRGLRADAGRRRRRRRGHGDRDQRRLWAAGRSSPALPSRVRQRSAVAAAARPRVVTARSLRCPGAVVAVVVVAPLGRGLVVTVARAPTARSSFSGDLMALTAGEYISGGEVRDADGRTVVIVEGGAGGGVTQGLAAARPTGGAIVANSLYFATDNQELSIANAAGNAWQQIGSVVGSYGGGGSFNIEAGSLVFAHSGYKIDNNGPFGPQAVNGGFSVGLLGKGFGAKEGANAKQGTFTMNGTTNVTVANTSVTANSRILFSLNAISGVPGIPGIVSRIAGTSFTVVSTAATDLGTYAFEIFEPG